MQLYQQLNDYLAKLADGGLCIAFSGGVDSALLLKAACLAAPGKVHAVTMYTPFHSPLEPVEAAAYAGECGAAHTVIRLESMPDEVMRNPPDRCYLCKRALFRSIGEYAAEMGLQHVLDGTNADDCKQYRPGLRALFELEVASPLAELGIAKEQIREMAAEMGLAVAHKPSAPCLATRFPYYSAIESSLLPRIDRIEQTVRAAGPRIVRARVHGDTIRLEVLPKDFAAVLQKRETLLAAVRAEGFSHLTLDLAGYRSGSSFDDPYRSGTNGAME